MTPKHLLRNFHEKLVNDNLFQNAINYSFVAISYCAHKCLYVTYISVGTCFPQGKRGKCPGPQFNGG